MSDVHRTPAPDPGADPHASAAIDQAAAALAEAARAYAVAHADTDDPEARGWAGRLGPAYALAALAGVYVPDDVCLAPGLLHAPGEPPGLPVGYRTVPGDERVEFVPSGRRAVPTPGTAATVVSGTFEALGERVEVPVDPADLARGPAGLGVRALDCVLCAAEDVARGPLVTLAATVALSRGVPLAWPEAGGAG